ncbi:MULTISPECIES: hypothetical protein [unclassified Janthinobacterium]|uniref:hypothetical protein n=1 Tax=unclassified Janthinobacterium TaxID=2610881 RepID=UPI0008855569|nr:MULTISPECIES: hypothetical protein [unclassified Janthinobacterium]SDA60783.1 hypothetical protein SAMN03159349_02528 [Janthinobacterium sp. 551a]SFB35030.1 hypothetical protein SAMN03159300_103533 [Janthinobacterium sp. 344]
MTENEAQSLLRGDFGRELLRTMMRYATSIAWGKFDNSKWQVMNAGTAFILDCGQGPFLVTAAHVYEGYLEAKRSSSILRCQLGQTEFDLEARLICSLGSKTLDIATFKIEADEIATLGKMIVSDGKDWPPKDVTPSDGIFFGGFPGKERKQINFETINFGIYAALTPVSSSSERQFGCTLDPDEWIDTTGHGIPAEGYDLGGISGAPAFAVQDSAAGVFSWRFTGVVHSATNNIGAIVLIHHARFIRSDGSLLAPD